MHCLESSPGVQRARPQLLLQDPGRRHTLRPLPPCHCRVQKTPPCLPGPRAAPRHTHQCRCSAAGAHGSQPRREAPRTGPRVSCSRPRPRQPAQKQDSSLAGLTGSTPHPGSPPAAPPRRFIHSTRHSCHHSRRTLGTRTCAGEARAPAVRSRLCSAQVRPAEPRSARREVDGARACPPQVTDHHHPGCPGRV